MAPPPTCYLRLSFLLHLSGFCSLVAGYCTPYWTHIKLTTGDVQALGLVVNCYRDGCHMLHVTSERTVFIIIFGLCTGTLVLALFSVQAFCLALCNGSCKTRNVGACYSYFSFLVAFCLGGTLALYQIDLTQQLRPDVLTVRVGWSRWCLVAATGGFLLGAMLNTCDSVKRNRLHRQEVHKKAEGKGKMMAEMEARRRQAAAAALRAKAGGEGKRDGAGGSGGGNSGGGGAGRNNFKMTAQVAARAAAASIVGARERGDFKGRRLSIAVDAAVTNALAQLNLQNSLTAGNTNKSSPPDPANAPVSRQPRPGDRPTNSQRNTDGVILVNEAAATSERHATSSDRRRAQNVPRVTPTLPTHQTDSKDGGEDLASNRFARNTNERNSSYKEVVPTTTTAATISTRASTTTTTSLHNTTLTTSSAMPSIENLKKSKLTKADHVDSRQDLNRLARQPVVREERADNPTSSLDEKSRARLEEAQALRRRVSDTKGFSSNYSPLKPQTESSAEKRDKLQDNDARKDLSSSVTGEKTNMSDFNTELSMNPEKESNSSSENKTKTKETEFGSAAKDTLKHQNPDETNANSDIYKHPKPSDAKLNSKPDELSLPISQGRRKSALGDALLDMTSFISEMVSIGGEKSPIQPITPKPPSVVRKTRDSTESFSREMGIDPLPPLPSTKKVQPTRTESNETSEKPHKLSTSGEESSARSLSKTASMSDTADNQNQIDGSKDKTKASQSSSDSNPTCDDGKRVILPRLTSVESTSKPANSGDSKVTAPSSKKKENANVVKVEEMKSDSSDAKSTSNDAKSTSGDSKSKSFNGKNVTGMTQATKEKVPAVGHSQTLPAQVSEEEMKRRKLVESMVRVNKETRKKRITQ